MDFEEFLLAIGENKLLELIKESYIEMKPMLDITHEKALKLYNEHICLGGMPAAILNYIEHDKNILKFEDDVLNMIITSYLADMSKYTENIEAIRNNKIYSSNMLLKCQAIETPKSPLKAYTESNFKIYLSDIGILRVLSKISINEIITNKNMHYKGVFIENYVAENLFSKYRELYYWTLGNIYEVDFLINIDGDIILIEVKSSDNTTSKSLKYYIGRYKPKYSIRLSSKNFGEANVIKSIPLYASFLI